MKEIIEWLMYIESIAAQLYREAADYFDDPAFKKFLENNAREETYHHRIMSKALAIHTRHPEVESAFSLDAEIKETIQNSFLKTLARLNSKQLTREMMIDYIVTTEYSEWNDIFLYAVNSLKENHPDFKSVASRIQNHLRQIEHYLTSNDYGLKKVEDIRSLQPVWTEKILVVEDDPIISKMLVAILKRDGEVDTAKNGQQGLEMIRRTYYRLILSDIHMPVVDGITLFGRVAGEFPGIEERYLFFTGNPSGDVVDFLNSHGLRYLVKPASFQQLREAVMAVLKHSQHN